MCAVVLVSAPENRKERGGGDTAATVDPVGQGGWAESCIQSGMGHERERGAGEVAFEQRPEPSEGPGAMHISGESTACSGHGCRGPQSGARLVVLRNSKL